MLSDRHYMRGNGPRRVRFGPHPSVIKHLIIANIVVFILTGFGRFPESPVMQALALHPYHIRHFQIWRLFTYMFVHGGFFHLLFNMWGLWLFGAPVEQRLGPHRFLRLYFISGVVGGIAWTMANWNAESFYHVMMYTGDTLHQTEKWVQGTAKVVASTDRIAQILSITGIVVGASGGVFGVMMACAMTFPNMVLMFIFPPIPVKVRTFVFFYGAVEVMSAWQDARGYGTGVAHLAHLGGLLGAFFYMKHLGFSSPYTFFRRWLSKLRRAWKRRKMKVVGNAPPPYTPPPGMGGQKPLDSADLNKEIDRILDKIGVSGFASLTPEERTTLEHAGKRFKKRDGR